MCGIASAYLRALGPLHGVGKETMEKLHELYRTGRLARYEKLANDPMMVALRDLKRVWGVGKVRACGSIAPLSHRRSRLGLG